jgi:hypothetical protein
MWKKTSNQQVAQLIKKILSGLEVKEALKRMKGGKALGPANVPIEVCRSLGDVVMVWLTKLFNHIFVQTGCPKSGGKTY